MKHIEYEERVMINKSDYEKVIDDIKNSVIPCVLLSIENIYLDDDESTLKNNGQMLRIRNTNNVEKELTLKSDNEKHETVEINETLDSHPTIDKHLVKPLNELREIGRMTTKRIEVKYDGYLLVVDENRYFDIVDHDIEIESDSKENALQIIQKYCKKYGLIYDSHYKTKSRRVYEQIKK